MLTSTIDVYSLFIAIKYCNTAYYGFHIQYTYTTAFVSLLVNLFVSTDSLIAKLSPGKTATKVITSTAVL